MSEQTMVERVAAAIAFAAIGADVWPRMASTQRSMFRAQARAAIAVMREPDILMIGANLRQPADARVMDIYRAMIDAALSETEA